MPRPTGVGGELGRAGLFLAKGPATGSDPAATPRRHCTSPGTNLDQRVGSVSPLPSRQSRLGSKSNSHPDRSLRDHQPDSAVRLSR
jgi:hypothetical protein